MSRGKIPAIVVLALVSGVAGFFLSRETVTPPTIAVAERSVPSFSLIDVEGQIRDSSEWSGQIRLINFWATWCPPCRREIPLLIELQNEYRGRVQVIGVAIDDLDAVQAYATETSFNYPVLVGQQEAIDLGNAFLPDFVGLPFTVIADADDRIVRVHVGELHREQADAFLAELL